MALKLDELAQLCDLHAKNYHAIMFMLKTVPKILYSFPFVSALQVLFYFAGNRNRFPAYYFSSGG